MKPTKSHSSSARSRCCARRTPSGDATTASAYFSDRSRLFQADRSRRFIVIVAEEGPHA